MPNVAPSAVDDGGTVIEDAVLTASGNVLANDGDGGDGPAALSVADAGVRAGSYGTLTLGADGGWTYQLDNTLAAVQALAAGQSLTEAFAYTASDGADTATATLTVTIEGADEPSGGDPVGTAFRLEAETLSLTDLETETKSFASGGSMIRIPVGSGTQATGTATGTFGGVAGSYDIVLGYFDEADGDATVEVLIDGVSIGTYVMDQGRVSNTASGGNFTEATLATGLQVAAGASVELRLAKQGGELARIDFVDFLPSSGGGDPGEEAFFIFAGQSNARDFFPNSRNGGDSTGIDTFVQDYKSLTGTSAVETLNTAVGASAADRAATGSSTSTNYWWDLDAGVPGPRLLEAIEDIRQAGGTVDGIVWIQGEQDGVGISEGWTTVDRYKQATLAIFDHFRAELGDPDLPFYIQQIGTDTDASEAAGYHEIRRAQIDLADPAGGIHLATVSYDQPLRDSVHFTPEGYGELGARMARYIADAEGTSGVDGAVGPQIGDVAVTAGRDLVLTIAHDAGSDLSAGGYDGFRVVGAGGAVALASADRLGPDTIGLDLGADPGLRFTVSYINGAASWDLADVVRDDAPDLSLPLRPFDLELVWGTDADDLVVVDTDALFKAIGGAGDDTLELDGSGLAFDFTGTDAADRFDFERLDLGGGGNGVAIDEGYLLGLAGTGATGLTIDGTGADTADLDGLGGFAFAGTVGGYDTYAASGIDFTLRVDEDIATGDVLIA